jgi:hypothetical protein
MLPLCVRRTVSLTLCGAAPPAPPRSMRGWAWPPPLLRGRPAPAAPAVDPPPGATAPPIRAAERRLPPPPRPASRRRLLRPGMRRTRPDQRTAAAPYAHTTGMHMRRRLVEGDKLALVSLSLSVHTRQRRGIQARVASCLAR